MKFFNKYQNQILLFAITFVLGTAIAVFSHVQADQVDYIYETLLIANSLKQLEWFGNESIVAHGFIFKIPVAIIFALGLKNLLIPLIYNVLISSLCAIFIYEFLKKYLSDRYSFLGTLLVLCSYSFISEISRYMLDSWALLHFLIFLKIFEKRNFILIGLYLLICFDAKESIAIVLYVSIFIFIPYDTFSNSQSSLLRNILNIATRSFWVLFPLLIWLFLMFFTSIIPVNIHVANLLNLTKQREFVKQFVDISGKSLSHVGAEKKSKGIEIVKFEQQDKKQEKERVSPKKKKASERIKKSSKRKYANKQEFVKQFVDISGKSLSHVGAEKKSKGIEIVKFEQQDKKQEKERVSPKKKKASERIKKSSKRKYANKQDTMTKATGESIKAAKRKQDTVAFSKSIVTPKKDAKRKKITGSDSSVVIINDAQKKAGESKEVREKSRKKKRSKRKKNEIEFPFKINRIIFNKELIDQENLPQNKNFKKSKIVKSKTEKEKSERNNFSPLFNIEDKWLYNIILGGYTNVINFAIVYSQKILYPRLFSFYAFPFFIVIPAIGFSLSELLRKRKESQWTLINIFFILYILAYLLRGSHHRYLVIIFPIISLFFIMQMADAKKQRVNVLLILLSLVLSILSAFNAFDEERIIINITLTLFFVSCLMLYLYIQGGRYKIPSERLFSYILFIYSITTLLITLYVNVNKSTIKHYNLYGRDYHIESIAKYLKKKDVGKIWTNLYKHRVKLLYFYMEKDIPYNFKYNYSRKGRLLKDWVPKSRMLKTFDPPISREAWLYNENRNRVNTNFVENMKKYGYDNIIYFDSKISEEGKIRNTDRGGLNYLRSIKWFEKDTVFKFKNHEVYIFDIKFR